MKNESLQFNNVFCFSLYCCGCSITFLFSTVNFFFFWIKENLLSTLIKSTKYYSFISKLCDCANRSLNQLIETTVTQYVKAYIWDSLRHDVPRYVIKNEQTHSFENKTLSHNGQCRLIESHILRSQGSIGNLYSLKSNRTNILLECKSGGYTHRNKKLKSSAFWIQLLQKYQI